MNRRQVLVHQLARGQHELRAQGMVAMGQDFMGPQRFTWRKWAEGLDLKRKRGIKLGRLELGQVNSAAQQQVFWQQHSLKTGRFCASRVIHWRTAQIAAKRLRA